MSEDCHNSGIRRCSETGRCQGVKVEQEKKAQMIIRIEDPSALVGLTEISARETISNHGYDTRILKENFPYHDDYDPLRVNLVLENGKVIKATIG